MNNMNPKNVVIYHGNCADGFGAAWVVRKRLLDNGIKEEDITFVPGVYNKPAPIELCHGNIVTIVDFSYPHAVMDQIAEVSWGKPIWIDHHKTAIEDMRNAKRDFDGVVSLVRSGAYLAWDYFFGSTMTMPPLIRHIDDRDRWVFRLPGTREIQANLFSYPYDFEVWNKLMEMTNDELQNKFAVGGKAIERKHFKDMAELLEQTAYQRNIGQHTVMLANLPYTLSSDAGNILAKENANCHYVAIWYRKKDGMYYISLRSVGDFDVSAIAKKYGGGGHKNASGCEVASLEEFLEHNPETL